MRSGDSSRHEGAQGKNNRSKQEEPPNGSTDASDARSPLQLTKSEWWAVLKRTKDDVIQNNFSMVAASVAFFVLLGIVPGLAAVISIYGVIADAASVQQQLSFLSQLLPEQASKIMTEEMMRIADSPAAGWGAVLAILLALWTGASGTKALMTALNIAYEEDESRGFVKFNLVALGLTLAGVMAVVVSVALIVAIPVLLGTLGMSRLAQTAVAAARWPGLLLFAMAGIAALYRYAPARRPAQWRWVSFGAATATALWLAASALFSFYVSNFGSYNQTYGSLGAVVILLFWLYLSAFVLLLGAELNAEMEHQTAKDTTKGPDFPRGRRGAFMADDLPNE